MHKNIRKSLSLALAFVFILTMLPMVPAIADAVPVQLLSIDFTGDANGAVSASGTLSGISNVANNLNASGGAAIPGDISGGTTTWMRINSEALRYQKTGAGGNMRQGTFKFNEAVSITGDSAIIEFDWRFSRPNAENIGFLSLSDGAGNKIVSLYRQGGSNNTIFVHPNDLLNPSNMDNVFAPKEPVFDAVDYPMDLMTALPGTYAAGTSTTAVGNWFKIKIEIVYGDEIIVTASNLDGSNPNSLSFPAGSVAFDNTVAGFKLGSIRTASTDSHFTQEIDNIKVYSVSSGPAALNVTYFANGGTGDAPAALAVEAGSTFRAASPDGLTAPAGKMFKEWNTAANGTGTGYAEGALITIGEADLNLYAIWMDIPDVQWDVIRRVFVDYNDVDFPTVGQLPFAAIPGSIGHSAETNTIGIANGTAVQGSYDGNRPSKQATGNPPFTKRAGDWNESNTSRGSQANFHAPVESNYRISMSFDWYPGTVGSGTGNTVYRTFSIADNNSGGFHNSGGTQDDQFINFIVSNASGYQGLYYIVGNMLDVSSYRVGGSAGAVSPMSLTSNFHNTPLPLGITSANSGFTTWYNIDMLLDFQARELSFTMKNAQTGAVVFESPVHKFAHEDPNAPNTWPGRYHETNEQGTPIERQNEPLRYRNQIGNFRFYNAGSGGRSQIDNILIEAFIPFVPPVLSNPTNNNPARGTMDITIEPYGYPEGSVLDSFNIFASTDGGAEVLVKTVSSAGVHAINVPRGNATHVITAEAVFSDGTVTNRSNALNVVHAGVTADKPGLVTSVNFVSDYGKIDLSWTPIANADEYIIYRAFFARSAFEPIGIVYGTTAADTVFSDVNARLTPTAHTYYRIEAIGDAGSGGLSSVFASALSGYGLNMVPRVDGLKDRALTAVNLAGNKGAEILVTAAGPDGQPLTSGVYLSWRWFEADYAANTTFTLFKNGVAIESGLTVTNLVDPAGGPYDIYRIVGTSDTAQGITAPDIRVWNDYFQELQLYVPPMQIMFNGARAFYKANDIIVGDLTGDGTYDILVKWMPTNALDASAGGQTATTIFDAYTVDWNSGETVLLWRVDLGANTRSSSHFAQAGVADFRGIGRDDVILTSATSARSYRSTDGTDQTLVMSSSRVGNGNIGTAPTGTQSGISHMTAVDGITGEFISSIAVPSEVNNGSRWNASVAYLRGHHERPAFVTGGQYGTIRIAEWRFNAAGTALELGWTYTGGGAANHNMITGDIHGPDAQGRRYDSVIMGATIVTVNAARNGLVQLNNIGVHGDAMHMSNFVYDPVNYPDFASGYPRQFLMLVQETSSTSALSALTRDTLAPGNASIANGLGIIAGWNGNPNIDTGRGAAGDVDPTSKNAEMWAANGPRQPGGGGNWNLRVGGLYSMETYGIGRANASNDTGNLVKLSDVSPSMNFTLLWDGNLLTQLQDHEFNEQVGYVPINTNITAWDYLNDREIFLFKSDEVYTINGTKGNPNFQLDVLGDWREEVAFRSATDDSKVRIYMTTIQTDYILPHLMEDHNYMLGNIYQHSTYNQPPNTSYMPSSGVITARNLDYSTLSSTAGVVMSYEPANDGTTATPARNYGFEITSHQLWRATGAAPFIDLTPKGSLSNSTRLQLLAAGYVLVGEAQGSAPITDATALVGGTYSYIVVGASNGKLSYIGRPATFTIEDRSAAVESVTVTPETATLTTAGATVQLTATVIPANAMNPNVVWTSSNEFVATVDDNGLVTAVSNGVAVITATTVDGGFTATAAITVAIPTYTVTFMLDEDEVYVVRSAFRNVPMGDDMVLNPYKAGAAFAGWFDALTGGNEFTANTVVTGNITVYARFTTSSATSVKAGDRWQFNFTAPTPANPAGWITIPINSNTANQSSAAFPATTPLYPASKAQIGETGVFWGMTTSVVNVHSDNGASADPTWTTTTQNLVTRGNVVENNSWYARNWPANTLDHVDRFGSTISVPREVIAGYSYNHGLFLDLPNGAYDVIAIFGDSRPQGGTTRGSLIFHNEPTETDVARTSNETNAPNQRVLASREALNPAVNTVSPPQNAQNGGISTVKLNPYNNVLVDNGFLSIETAGFNLAVPGYIIVVYALHAPIEQAIGEAGKLIRTNYTVASWLALEAAIEAGQAAMKVGGNHVTDAYNQAAIDGFAAAINLAIENLVPVGATASYTVTFDSAGGSPVDAVIVEEGAKVAEPADPVRTDYVFLGWFLNGALYDFEAPVTADITLVAQWKIITFNVSFLVDGDVYAQDEVSIGGTATAPANPVKAGYEFTGWFLDGVLFDFETPIFANVALEAGWYLIPLESLRIADEFGAVAAPMLQARRGSEEKFTALAFPVEALTDLVWTINNASLASVTYEDGVATVTIFGNPGNATLTVRDMISGKTHSIIIRIA